MAKRLAAICKLRRFEVASTYDKKVMQQLLPFCPIALFEAQKLHCKQSI